MAEGIEQTDVEPGAEHTTLGLEVVKLGVRETERLGRDLVEILYYIIALADALEAAVPLGLGVTTILNVPLVIVELAPFAAVVPPTVTGRRDELVGRKLVEHMTALDAPEGVLERTECGSHHIHLGVIIVLCSYLVVKRFAQISTAREGQSTKSCGYNNIEYLHCFLCL